VVPTLDANQRILVNPAATHPKLRPDDRVRGIDIAGTTTPL
jgi:hypothetical protein